MLPKVTWTKLLISGRSSLLLEVLEDVSSKVSFQYLEAQHLYAVLSTEGSEYHALYICMVELYVM